MERVEERTVSPSGEKRLYYVLRPVFQTCVITTPVEGGKIPIRPIMSHDEANALIDSIPGRNDRAYFNRNLNELREHYRAIVDMQDAAELLGLTISLYRKREESRGSGRKFGMVDERYMKEAESLLFGELSVTLGIPYDEVTKYIIARLGVKD